MTFINIIIIIFQLLLVTGGYGESGIHGLDTTEVFQDNVWRTVAGKLPAPTSGLRAATVDNSRVLSFGMLVLFD